MFKKLFLIAIALVLIWGLWISPDFTEIAAGVAIFLFGMLALEQGFRAFTGGLLEKIMRRTTNTLPKSLLFGIVSTTLVQSSSLVSVITISFLSTGLLGLAAGIGIIFGANLGTTTGAWLVAGFGLKVKISAYAMPMLVFGILLVFQKHKYARGLGYVLAGMGFLFLGIHHMKEGFEAFRDTIDLSQFGMTGIAGLLLYSGLGVAATVIMQSSHATLVLIITALSAGQISYENALALAIGANVGTTITAIIGSLGANEQGKRLAAAHLVFNLVTGLTAMLLIRQFVLTVDTLSEWVGIGSSDYTLKLALFHSLFNLLGILVMLPFINPLVSRLETMFKGQSKKRSEPRFLFESATDFPDTALEAVRKETLHVFDNAFVIIARGICVRPARIRSQDPIEPIVREATEFNEFDMETEYENKVKPLFGEIILFISKAPFNWEVYHSGRMHWMRDANRKLIEAIKDTKHLRTNLSRYLESTNPVERQFYDAMRIQIVTILRELYQARLQSDQSSSLLGLDALKLLVLDNDRERQRNVAEMLKLGRLSPVAATSILNDNGYTLDISEGLIAFAETLFVSKDEARTGIEREIALVPEEIEEIREK